MARRKGYRNYYEYRVLFDNGRIPPSGKPIPAGERGLTRGHAGQTKAFLKSLREGDVILCDITAVKVRAGRTRRHVARYVLIEKTVIPAELGRRERTWKLRNLSRRELIRTIEAEIRRGVVFSPSPSMDQRRLVSDDESEGGY